MDTAKIELFTEVEQLATKQQLGRLQKSYTKTDDNKRLFLNAIVWIGASILGMIFVIAVVLRLTLPGPLAGLSNYLTAALRGVIGIVIVYGCFRQWQLNLRAYRYQNREQVHIYTDGMVYLEGQLANLTVRWDQIAELTRGDIDDEASGKVSLDRLYLTMTYEHDVEHQVIFQPALPQCPEICAQVEQAYTDARLPALLTKYRAGERLEFADLTISQTGISIPRISAISDTPTIPNTHDRTERDEFTWSQLEALGAIIEVSQPYTTIAVNDAKNSIRFREFTCEIVNVSLFKALLAVIKQ